MSLKKPLAFGLIVFLFFPAVCFSQSAQSEPLTLEQCVQIAMQQNSQVLNAERRVQVAETQVTSTRAFLLPRIDASFSSRRRRSLFDTGGRIDLTTGEPVPPGSYSNSHSISFQLRQTLFDFGQTWTSIKQANASKDASVYSFETTKQNAIYSVYQGYYQLLKDIRLLEVNKEAVKQSEEQLKRSQSMYEIGSVAQADVFRAQTQLGSDKIALVQQENAVRFSRASLNVTLGRNADAPLDIKDLEDINEPVRPYNIEEVMNSAVQNNPNMSRFQSEMKAATYGSRAAKMNYLPTISLSADYSRSGSEFDFVYSEFNTNFTASIGLGLSFNIFNGFSDMANVAREATNYRIAQENLIDQERQIREQVLQALLNLQGWREISTINAENLKSAQEDLRLAQERYRVGAGTILDVQVAQTNLTRSRSTLVRAKYDTKISEAQLWAAMGTLK